MHWKRSLVSWNGNIPKRVVSSPFLIRDLNYSWWSMICYASPHSHIFFSHTHFFCVMATVRFCSLLSREHILHMFHTQTNKQTMTHTQKINFHSHTRQKYFFSLLSSQGQNMVCDARQGKIKIIIIFFTTKFFKSSTICSCTFFWFPICTYWTFLSIAYWNFPLLSIDFWKID